MSEIDQLLQQLPTDKIAQQLGTDPQSVESAARAALPALFGGLQANAMDPAGESSLMQALQQHDPSLAQGGIDISQVDTADGERIAQHIFGGQQEEVVNRLGGVSGNASSGLISKLIPILAPIVLSYLMGRIQQGGGGMSLPGGTTSTGQGSRDGGVLPGTNAQAGTSGTSTGGLGDVLGSILGGGAAPGSGNTQQGGMPSSGAIITDILGGLLGGGRR